MTADHREAAFEAAIEAELVAGGYAAGKPGDFDAERALIDRDLFAFIEASQPELWAQLRKDHGAALEDGLRDAVERNVKSKGTLNVLRHGFKYFGKRIDAAIFRPAHGLNPELERQYRENRVTVTRQVRFKPDGGDSVDMLISLNGLAVATIELKNSLTGQTVAHAIRQYRDDRDPKLPLFQFKRGALVHFAVDTDEVYMTTRLAGRQTRFLPFNRGRDGGAGNPSVQGEDYRTAYLWREVLERHSLLDILGRFMHLAVEDKRGRDGKVRKAENLIFPRYHQLDAVRRLEVAARDEGPGRYYLVQHSAGSGKSNSIAWTAHRLASLHDERDRKVFHAVVVVTDRRVLDQQLQETIYQFEHKQGVVARIDQHSEQLAKALAKGTPIIITTLQKFPFVAEKVGELPDRRYAVIVDEAHSSQTGEAARSLKEVLGAANQPLAAANKASDSAPPYGAATDPDADEPEAPTSEDVVARTMESRGRQNNLSFFAFTATPKAKTLELFGRPGDDGRPLPFHVYAMRQAIEEGFILDVLRNYTTYKAYYRLVQTRADRDPDVKKREATRALARFMSLHPHNISQKTEVILEHFRKVVGPKLQGRAKGMVVTRSRLHAVRYKQAFDAYLRDKGYRDLQTLVAFSGTVLDPDAATEHTEVGMNAGISEKQVPEHFESDNYQVLIVANKYQTGFDQPLLTAMYVDRKLSGVQAVQTLSRLNRTYPGKAETFVLDFANEADEIQAAFQPYYEVTTVSEAADPHQLEALQHELDAARVWTESELESFAKVFYKPKQSLTEREHAELHRQLQPAVDRFAAWDDGEEREAWRGKLQAFTRLYAFLSQVMPWTDRELEIRYSFGRFLLRRLPREAGERLELEGDVDVHSYRLARIGEAHIQLEAGEPGQVRGPAEVGTSKAEDDEVPLHQVIDVLNERFGTDFTEADQLFFDAVTADGKADSEVRSRAEANSFENFELYIKKKLEGLIVDRMDRNQAIVTKLLDEGELRRAAIEAMARSIYDDIREAG